MKENDPCSNFFKRDDLSFYDSTHRFRIFGNERIMYTVTNIAMCELLYAMFDLRCNPYLKMSSLVNYDRKFKTENSDCHHLFKVVA